MTVTYHLKKGGDRFFMEKYPNLCRRVKILQESIVACQNARGALPSESANWKAYHAPIILDVTFEKKLAENYEALIEKLLLMPFSKVPSHVPVPDMCITVLLDFGYGVREERVYDFSRSGNFEYLEDFCREVCDYANKVFRMYFDPMRIPDSH